MLAPHSAMTVAIPPTALRGGHEHAEDEAAADHDLLDVHDVDRVGREHVEQRGRHPGPVPPGDRHQQRPRSVHKQPLLVEGPRTPIPSG
jgi:hypothetical protein